jgi:gluconolactonase
MRILPLPNSIILFARSFVPVVVSLFIANLSLGQSGAPRPQTGVNPSSDTGEPIIEPTPRPDGTWADAPEATLPPDAPKGQMLNFSFGESKIYPGTQRDVSVYVPSAYTGERPACLYVKLDGSTWASWNEPAVFENLIAKHEMPVTIMVALTHGTIWKDKENEEGLRYDRTYEWDSTNDNLARFLETELLPAVEKQVTPDGKPIRLSRDPNDRAIAGLSSGGIGAFTAAWQRPDLFSRVISTIGTFITMRGGDQYPGLIRKTEPKPLRIFLEDGSADTWNPAFGSWWLANQDMETALAYADYDLAHAWGTHGHDFSVMRAILPEVLRWIWRDWPAPVRAGFSGNSTLREVLVPGESWQRVADGLKDSTGLAMNPKGDLVFADAPDHAIYKLTNDRKLVPLFPNAPAIRGLAFDQNGVLYATVPTEKKIVSIDSNAARHDVTSDIRGYGITVTNSGAIFVSEPGEHSDEPSRLWLIEPGGKKTLLDSGLSSASGIAVAPDRGLLLATEKSTQWIYSYVLQADNTLQNKQRYFWLHMTDIPNNSGAEDLCYDVNGNLYIATNLGIQVADRSGRVRAILPLPTPCGPVRSICFGGPDFQTLFATDGRQLFARKMNIRGYAPWAPPQRIPFRGWG